MSDLIETPDDRPLDALRQRMPGYAWEPLGEHRYRARSADGYRWLYVKATPDASTFVRKTIADIDEPDVTARVLAALDQALAHTQLPECIAPGCGDRAPRRYTAAETGRFAGRDFNRGDVVDLCPAHGHDVDTAAFVHGLDALPDWLRADAQPFWMDAYDLATDTLLSAQVRAQQP